VGKHRWGRVPTALIAAGILVAGCSDDGGGSAEPEATTTTEEATTTTAPPRDPPAEGFTRLELDGVPFTFDYPVDFIAVPDEQLPQGFLAIIGLDQINFLDVRLTSQEELTDEEIEEDIGASLETETSRIVQQSSTRRSNLDSVDFTVEDTSGAAPTISKLHFFRADDRTWEIACQSDPAGRARIDAACATVLDTIRIES
jgi:hypothetical protein